MKKQVSTVFAAVLCIVLLLGCGSIQKQPEASVPDTEKPTSASAEMATPTIQDTTPAPKEPEPAETEAIEDVPPPDENTYRLTLPGFIAIFDEPTYDGRFVRTIGEDGVYTIVEEKVDSEGFVWGKLKSGVGWISLSELEANLPVMAGLGTEKMLKNPHYLVNVEDAEFMEYLVFAPTQTITDVQFTMLLLEEGGYAQDTLFDTIPKLEPGMPLIAQVVFYGDFTTYGLSFKDAAGTQRYFAVYISGRNGAPVLQEYTP